MKKLQVDDVEEEGRKPNKPRGWQKGPRLSRTLGTIQHGEVRGRFLTTCYPGLLCAVLRAAHLGTAIFGAPFSSQAFEAGGCITITM